ncbi:hypothetical protein JQR85_06760 [Stutzerimonas urumqiensis]|uniref:hypothetical protein n=1 Tax=Stutzerimonas urumqiensis TaxID=638269 RepID=UPI003DA605B0
MRLFSPHLTVVIVFFCCGFSFAVIGLATGLETFLYMAPGFLIPAIVLFVTARRGRNGIGRDE